MDPWENRNLFMFTCPSFLSRSLLYHHIYQIRIFWFFFPEFFVCVHCNTHISKFTLLDHCRTCPYATKEDSSYNYVCFACEYHNYSRQKMQYHIRTHTGDKPYKCVFCSYSCKQPNDLNRHVKIRHATEH